VVPLAGQQGPIGEHERGRGRLGTRGTRRRLRSSDQGIEVEAVPLVGAHQDGQVVVRRLSGLEVARRLDVQARLIA
jgi:hypothetical protein